MALPVLYLSTWSPPIALKRQSKIGVRTSTARREDGIQEKAEEGRQRRTTAVQNSGGILSEHLWPRVPLLGDGGVGGGAGVVGRSGARGIHRCSNLGEFLRKRLKLGPCDCEL